jgi:hypothetical protein
MKAIFFVAFSLGVSLAGGISSPAGAAGQPTIQPVGVPGYMLAAQGSGWPADARVTFTLTLGPKTYGLELRTTKSGMFEVGAKKVDFCHGSLYSARDFSGDRASGPVGDPYCAPHASTSRLVVLQGRQIKPKITRLYGTNHSNPTRMLVGDALYLWEKGKTSPAFMPTAPDKYFSLIGHGQAPSPACTKSACGPGFYWRWIGMKPARTDITLVPWCGGQLCPENYVIAVPVDIKRRPD